MWRPLARPTTYAEVMYSAFLSCATRLLTSFSQMKTPSHSLSNVLTARQCAGEKFSSRRDGLSFDLSSSLGDNTDNKILWLTFGGIRRWSLVCQWTWKHFFFNSNTKEFTSSSLILVLNMFSGKFWTWMTWSSRWTTHHKSYTTAAQLAKHLCSCKVYQGSFRNGQRTS